MAERQADERRPTKEQQKLRRFSQIESQLVHQSFEHDHEPRHGSQLVQQSFERR